MLSRDPSDVSLAEVAKLWTEASIALDALCRTLGAERSRRNKAMKDMDAAISHLEQLTGASSDSITVGELQSVFDQIDEVSGELTAAFGELDTE